MSPLLRPVVGLLDMLGRHATLFMAGGALFGLLLPQLASLARPLLAPLVIVLLALALMRVPLPDLMAQIRRPWLAALAAAWLLLATAPLMAGTLALFGPLDSAGVETGMVLMAAMAPITSAPAIALMMGLPLPVCLAATLLAMALVPLSVPWMAVGVLGLPVSVDAAALSARLALVIGGGVAVAALARRLTSAGWRARQGRRLDGLAVIMLFGFALAIMEGVGPVLESEPVRVLALIGLSFLACGGMMVVTTLVFWPAGRPTALGLGYLSSSRNMGVLLAGLPAGTDADIALWFALAQFPLYMLPALLRPLVRRLSG